MNECIGEIKAFREAIDATLASNALLIEDSKFLPIGATDYRHDMTIGNLSFTSVDQKEARLNLFRGGHEHLWGIGYSKVRALGRTASVTVVSTMDRRMSLERRLSFESAIMGFPIVSSIELEDEEDLVDAVKWASSPLMNSEIMLRFATPLESEIESIKFMLAEDDAFRTERIRSAEDALFRRRAHVPDNSRPLD